MEKKRIPLASSELATLWIVYQKKTMMLRVIEHFLAHSQDNEAKQILDTFNNKEKELVNELVQTFEQAEAKVPVGFTENDLNLNAPALFDDMYGIMYLRIMMKIASGIHALHFGMAYRKDIIDLYKKFSVFAEDSYNITTQYLLEKGVLPRSPNVSMPNQATFVKDKKYRSGFKLVGNRRPLNTVEVSYIYAAIEANVVGMKLMTGFSQVAKEKDVRKYFSRGKDLSKQIISEFNEILLDSDIMVASTAAGHVTDSTTSPFSDKLMMYNASLLTSFGLGSNALGTSFSLRKDLPPKMIMIAKDIFNFASDGGDMMIEYGWTEEPPQMEDRTELSQGM